MTDSTPLASEPMEPPLDPPMDSAIDLAKLIRFRQMLQTTLTEIRQLDADPASLARLASVHNEVERQLGLAVSEELRAELADFSSCCNEPSPTESQIRVAQAQLLGWVEGLLNGVQVAARMAQAAPPPAPDTSEVPAADDGFGPSTYL